MTYFNESRPHMALDALSNNSEPAGREVLFAVERSRGHLL